MVRRSKNLATGILIRMQRPRARLGTNRRPPSRIDHASLYRFPFRFSIGNKNERERFFCRDLIVDREMRITPIDGWWIAPSGRERGGFAHLLRRTALRCVTLRYVWVTDLFWTASFRKKQKKIIKRHRGNMRNIRNRVILQDCDERISDTRFVNRFETALRSDRTTESISIYMDEL